MKNKLTEALQIVSELTCDIEGRYPIGLIRVERLLEEVVAEVNRHGEEVLLTDRDPFPAA